MSWKYCKVHGNYQSFGGTRGCPDCLKEVEDATAHREMMREQATEQAERDSEERQEIAERLERMREEAAEQAERDREERRQAAEEAEFKRANPGDYGCPNCGYTTLKRGKSRCPKCQGTVNSDFWPPIYEAERLAAERREAENRRKAEEWERGRPERERKAAEAQQEAEEARLEIERQRRYDATTKRLASWSSGFLYLYVGYLVPSLLFYTLRAVTDPSQRFPRNVAEGLLFVPVFNWAVHLGMAVDYPHLAGSAARVLGFWVGFGALAFIGVRLWAYLRSRTKV